MTENTTKPEERNAMTLLEDRFLELAKQGIVLSVKDLQKLSSDLGLPTPDARELAKLRYGWKYTALHSRWTKPAHFMTGVVEKLGCIFVDMAEFKKNLVVSNAQIKYFLVGVDSLSQLLCVVPCVNKKQTTWEEGIVRMMQSGFPYLHTIVSDRDAAVTGIEFQREVKEKYGISWLHLRNRSKSYHAERMIRYMKSRLSIALAGNDRGDNNWIKHIPGIVSDYNKRFVNGTKIRRIDVSKENYLQILEQRWKLPDASFALNTRQANNFSPALTAKLFKYKPGDKVLLSYSANYAVKHDVFSKKSTIGSYAPEIYEIEAVTLKSTDKFFYTPCYRLVSLVGLFYESELIPALFSGGEEEKRAEVAARVEQEARDIEPPTRVETRAATKRKSD